jgi:glycosyltransferase involved in cell wall biosynthesis
MVLSAIDIFVQSWPEKLWYPPLMEAMSAGNAVVAAGGVNNDLIINNKTALTFPFHNESALTDALDRLLKDQSYARTLARQGQQYLRKHFLASQMITHLAKAYRHAIKIKTS